MFGLVGGWRKYARGGKPSLHGLFIGNRDKTILPSWGMGRTSRGFSGFGLENKTDLTVE